MKILIQGAGIAGLALAREARAQGIEVVVIERAESLRPVGAGITLGANALGALSRTMDIANLRARGQDLRELIVADHRGRELSRIPTVPRPGAQGGLAIHRWRLHESLKDGLPDAVIRLGTTIIGIEERAETVTVSLSDGERLSVDAVVGADGFHSKIRERVDPAARFRYAGYTCWRAVIAGSLPRPDEAIEMWGRGRRMGIVPIAPDEIYCYLTLNLAEGEGRSLEPGRLRELFSGFRGPAVTLLERLFEGRDLIQNDLGDVSLTRWSAGRLLLIGDAAHAMTPNLGQGAAMGLEDAVVLSEIWKTQRGPGSLIEFERRRRSRVDAIQTRSRRLGAVAQWQSALSVWLRDALMRATPRASMEKNVREILAGFRP